MGETREGTHYLVFDVESIGLHGDGFAVGYVLVAPDGSEKASGLAWAHPDRARNGFPEDRQWIAENVLGGLSPMHRVLTLRDVRDAFWFARSVCPKNTVLAADVPWPVEARFLAACIDDNPSERNWEGPYPLLDIASVRVGAGLNALASEPREPNELPEHNPLADARQSARLLREALHLTVLAESPR